jgi:hypothetical protein
MDEYARLYRRREEEKRRRRRRRVAGLLAAFALLAIGGYMTTRALDRGDTALSRAAPRSIELTEARSRTENVSTTSEKPPTTGTLPGRVKPVSTELITAADRASFRRLELNLGGTSALAVSAVGLDQPVSLVGTLHGGVAWSTIKVPIAMAIETRAGGNPTAHEQSLLTRAITASDNSAAEALWSSLGPPSAAAAAVRNVLASTGDTATEVETRVLRPAFTSFGQTRWSLAAQQRFIAGLPCLPNAGPVLSLMTQVIPDQRWGLGSLGAETKFKGGWGPGPDGRYLVRQIGIVKLANGRSLAASIATMPADGSFHTGTAGLTQIANWLINHVEPSTVPAATCR